MTCIPAPACRAALREATARWPNRSRASDGICPSAAHTKKNPTSDHERGNAVDLTNDPAAGFDVHAWVRRLAAHGDPRVKYLISNAQIWNPTSEAWNTYRRLRAEGHSRRAAARMALPGWRTYTGSNPHRAHVHVSIKHSAAARNDTSTWFYDDAIVRPVPPAPPTTTPFPGERMYRIDHSSPLDDQGNGYVDLAGVAKDHIVSFVANGDDPSSPAGDVGYKPIPKFAPLAWGTGSRVVIEEGPPRGRIDFSVWVAD